MQIAHATRRPSPRALCSLKTSRSDPDTVRADSRVWAVECSRASQTSSVRSSIEHFIWAPESRLRTHTHHVHHFRARLKGMLVECWTIRQHLRGSLWRKQRRQHISHESRRSVCCRRCLHASESCALATGHRRVLDGECSMHILVFLTPATTTDTSLHSARGSRQHPE
ncbi:hypothetical protein OE88DRAFT_921417 [Heliocybe sulcata]|uniref:Uncharacterized protein n=1 Tax=Heliocybe sulcata TaxID=5364 RepID=A0A5C3MQT4_9AGAM|nr:hypothetical protein OE88DRAFT_921417 [Heliocybe sulcata]